jgi:hypothetical protein
MTWNNQPALCPRNYTLWKYSCICNHISALTLKIFFIADLNALTLPEICILQSCPLPQCVNSVISVSSHTEASCIAIYSETYRTFWDKRMLRLLQLDYFSYKIKEAAAGWISKNDYTNSSYPTGFFCSMSRNSPVERWTCLYSPHWNLGRPVVMVCHVPYEAIS